MNLRESHDRSLGLKTLHIDIVEDDPGTPERFLRAAIRQRVDPLEDQVRLYPTATGTFTERYIIGARTVEERADYWIVR